MNQHKKNIIAYLSGHCLQIPVIASHALPCTVIASAAKQTQATGSQKTATRSPAFRHYEPCPPQSRHCEQRSVIASKAKQSLSLIDNQIKSTRGAGTRHCERSEANPGHRQSKQTIRNQASRHYKQSEAIPSHFAYTNTTPQNAPISTPGDHQ
jgi:hypothetical protein